MDLNGKHQQGNWGNCVEDCPKGCHVTNQKSEIVECAFPFYQQYRDNQPINECIKQYPNLDDSPKICYTKKDNVTNVAIVGSGDWGICKKEYCPSFQGIVC